ncbi:PLS2-like protein [Mya arenaria]|uniref:Phospholipid scramblase n=1 Tax=Mya arenaria TaxID=6604 RepID=A0ABY7DH61_MYAAR|nr:PLS2-like protein [Mya arenaria]
MSTTDSTGIPGGNQAPVVWMPKPSVPGCPPGLEYLTEIDQILVKQQIDMLGLFTPWEDQNKYHLMNSMGQKEVVRLQREFRCMRDSCWFACMDCCAHVIAIEAHVISAKDGSEVGKVTKQWAGMMKEMFTQADNFGISFPMDLDDFMYFEQPANNNRHY